MTINDYILLILSIGFIIAAFDYVLGNKFGLGNQFQQAFAMLGSLMIVIVGMVTIAPIIANGLAIVSEPLYIYTGIDPAAVINTVLALDMGGYAMAETLSYSEEAALFAWVLLGTMYGPTLSFTVPVALGIIHKDDVSYFIRGILLGIICAPIGCLLGGFVAGFPLSMMLINLIPAIGASIIIIIGLSWKPEGTVQIFTWLGRTVTVIAVIGLSVLMMDAIFPGVEVSGITPIEESMAIVGRIVLVLAGAIPLTYLLSKALRKPLQSFGERIGINKESSTGLLASLAHAIPAFHLFHEMNPRGKVLVASFAVAGAFVFGGHLGFVAGIDADYVSAMVVGKLTAGVLALVVAYSVTKSMP